MNYERRGHELVDAPAACSELTRREARRVHQRISHGIDNDERGLISNDRMQG